MTAFLKPPNAEGTTASPFAAWAADYERTVLPKLMAAKRQLHRRFAVLVGLAVATEVLSLYPILTNQELGGWLTLPVVAIFLAGAWFIQCSRSLESRFQAEGIAKLLRLR